MTVIAMFNTELGPVLFGDLVLSANGANPCIRLATLGNVTEIFSSPG